MLLQINFGRETLINISIATLYLLINKQTRMTTIYLPDLELNQNKETAKKFLITSKMLFVLVIKLIIQLFLNCLPGKCKTSVDLHVSLQVYKALNSKLEKDVY